MRGPRAGGTWSCSSRPSTASPGSSAWSRFPETRSRSGGVLFVNGRRQERFVAGSAACEALGGHRHRLGVDSGAGPDQPRMDVPAGHLFVMGDNRGNSFDSRGWGVLPVEDVLGRVAAVYWTSGNGFEWSPLSGDECADPASPGGADGRG